MVPPKISVQSACFSYAGQEVWRNISLDVEKGETVCLLGPNGCGKTTLLNCIHGYLSLQRGKILLDGRNLKTMSTLEIAINMGYVFQEHSAPFPYSSLEVVRMGRAPHLGLFAAPSKKDTELAETIMEEMGISYLANQRYTVVHQITSKQYSIPRSD